MSLKALLEKYEGAGNFQRVGWFKLADDGDTAIVRFMNKGKTGTDAQGEDTYDLEIYEVHKVKIDGYDRAIKCLGDNCPLCRLGLRPSLRIWIPLINKSEPDKDKQLQLWERGLNDIKEILNLIEEYGDLNARDWKIKRNGKRGSQKTTYSYFPRPDKEPMELPEMPQILGRTVLTLTPEEMLQAHEGNYTLKKDNKDESNSAEDDSVF